jgi:hypothetical protein
MFITQLRTKANSLRRKLDSNWRSTTGRNTLYRILCLLLLVVERLKDELIQYIPTRPFLSRFFAVNYEVTIKFLTPINNLLAILLRNVAYKNSVLHISYMVHIPYDTTRLLRKFGMKADYLALERRGAIWDKSDYVFEPHPIPFLHALREFFAFWRIVAKYEIIHSHFAMRLTRSGWEYPLLKKMGRKIVVHYRGCEVRNRERNMALHPEVNICQQCDYNASICRDPIRINSVRMARTYGDLFLVTTPDMKDFVPDAIHFPFFLPQINPEAYIPLAEERPNRDEIKIVHVTGHPGIEGTREITQAIERLKAKGYRINFVFLHIIHHDHVLREIATADLTIGKMKMGYYANAQIESMYLGVPAITYVRPEFMTPELEKSGFIFCTLQNLEETLEYYLSHPKQLERKRQIARSSIMSLHSDERLAGQMIELYEKIKAGV